MKIRLTLNENFIEELSYLQDFNSLYAAMWILEGIKPIKQHYDGAAIKGLNEFNAQFVYNCCDSIGIYKLGYIRAMMDLEQPLIYDSELPTTQEFLGRAFDALGLKAFEKAGASE